MFRYDDFVTISAKLALLNPDDPDMEISYLFFKCREGLAELITEKSPQFQPVYDLIKKTNSNVSEDNAIINGLLEERNLIINLSQDVTTDIYFLVLIASILSFFCANDEAKEYTYKLIESIKNIDEEMIGADSILSFCSTLWNADYNGFRDAVKRRIIEIQREES